MLNAALKYQEQTSACAVKHTSQDRLGEIEITGHSDCVTNPQVMDIHTRGMAGLEGIRRT